MSIHASKQIFVLVFIIFGYIREKWFEKGTGFQIPSLQETARAQIIDEKIDPNYKKFQKFHSRHRTIDSSFFGALQGNQVISDPFYTWWLVWQISWTKGSHLPTVRILPCTIIFHGRVNSSGIWTWNHLTIPFTSLHECPSGYKSVIIVSDQSVGSYYWRQFKPEGKVSRNTKLSDYYHVNNMLIDKQR